MTTLRDTIIRDNSLAPMRLGDGEIKETTTRYGRFMISALRECSVDPSELEHEDLDRQIDEQIERTLFGVCRVKYHDLRHAIVDYKNGKINDEQITRKLDALYDTLSIDREI